MVENTEINQNDDEEHEDKNTEENNDTALIHVMIRLPQARITQIDRKVKVEKTHTTRAGYCRDAVISALDSPPLDVIEEIRGALKKGQLDEEIKKVCSRVMFN